MPLACWGYFVEEQGSHILLEIVGVAAHLPCCLTALAASMLWTCGLDPCNTHFLQE
jgi:hypothetical protein